jgi:pyruvate,orthophosphate dikinase
MLQTRRAQRTPLAALRIACDLVDEGLITPATAVLCVAGYDLDTISTARLDTNVPPIGAGIAAGSGVVAGRAAFSVERAQHLADTEDQVILVRSTATTEDIAGLAVCAGLVTGCGARTSHAAVVARGLGVVAVVGCRDMSIDISRERARSGEHEVSEGEFITIGGDRGLVFQGRPALTTERPLQLIERICSWHAGSGTGHEPSSVTPVS